MNWAEQLIQLRKAKGWSIRKLGEATAINISNLSRIERGEVVPTIDTIKRIAEALDADITIIKRDGN